MRVCLYNVYTSRLGVKVTACKVKDLIPATTVDNHKN